MKKYFSLFLFTIIFSTCADKSNKLIILFPHVNGLIVGSKVESRGIKIGEVKKLDLFGKQVLVDIELNSKTQIPIDSKITIKTEILGTARIDIEFSDNPNYLSSKDTVKGSYFQKALLDEFISDSTKRKQIEGSLQNIASDAEEIVERAKNDSNNRK